MKIDKKLNLVIPLQRADGMELFVHSTPISAEVFKLYWKVAAQTMNALYMNGIGMFAPRFALAMLREQAQDNAGADKQKQAQELQRVERGLVAEIRRLTNVLVLTDDKGWQMLPLHEALTDGHIGEEEVEEIDNAITYFTLASHTHQQAQREQWSGALSLWNARTELLDCTDFRNSLRTRTADATTGATGST